MYISKNWDGEITESEEMQPRWFIFDEIPYGSMWPDDQFWLPLVLAKEKVRAKFVLGEGDVVLEEHVNIVHDIFDES